MSSDYYFKKWDAVLRNLEALMDIDISYQERKTNDKKLCAMVRRLSGVLGGYIAVYNEALDCVNQHLQVQKTQHMNDVVVAVTQRILELKCQLSILENSNYQYMASGLIDMKLTTDDVNFTDIPVKATRAPEMQEIVDHVFIKAKEIVDRLEQEERERLEEEAKANDTLANVLAVWDDNEEDEESVAKLSLDEESLKRRDFINLIKKQEKTRQTTNYAKHRKLKLEIWEKILSGTKAPEARLDIKIRAAKMIQKYMRAYFEIKRKRPLQCKEEQLLDMKMCSKPSDDAKVKNEQIKKQRMELKLEYENDRKNFHETLKAKYAKEKTVELQEDYRNDIRYWFQRWYKQTHFFYDIPKPNQGGSTLIVKGIVPEPREWREQNAAWHQKMIANKKKNPVDLKNEKKEAKREALMQKRQELMKKKMEEKILKKMMKNPKMHPGFTYPKSKQMDVLYTAIQAYHNFWDDLDKYETQDVKKKYCVDLEKHAVCAEVKEEVQTTVDDVMRNELKILKTSLKEEYSRLEKEWPTVMPQKFPKLFKKKKEPKTPPIDKVAEKFVDLALKGFLKDYPQTKFENFKGEPNFAGADIRCRLTQAVAFGGETRNIWWERCREVSNGLRKILLVGPKGGGKTLLVHAMATANNAILFELDPRALGSEASGPEELKALITSVAMCAKAAQPAIIYIRHMYSLFYSKVPPTEPKISVDSLKNYLLKKLFKKFNKGDKVTFIGGVMDPWLLKSGQLLKLFPTVVLMPNTTCTTTFMLLKEWVVNNREVPKDLDVTCLAHVLQGYSYGYLQEALKNFLSAEQIVKIAVYGLTPQEVYDFILQDDSADRAEYENYLKWYSEKTQWGITEKKHLDAQLEFQEVERRYEEKMRKQMKTKSAASTAANSLTGSVM